MHQTMHIIKQTGGAPMPLDAEHHDLDSKTEAQWLELRRNDITASVVGALFGLHPYQTPAGLWAEKTGVEMPRRDTADMRRGRLLESAVAQAVKEKHPRWSIIKAREYLRAPAFRLGATPDYYVVDEQRGIDRVGVMQAKTVNQWEFDRHWEDGPPMWIRLQILTEMMLHGSNWGYVACLIVDGYSFDLKLYEQRRHPGAEQRIIDAVGAFWANVEAGREPQIDYERDGALIAQLHRSPRRSSEKDFSGDNALPELLDRHLSLVEWIKAAKTELEAVDNEIKHKLGDAEYGLVPGFKLSWKLQHQSGYSVAARDQRVLRIAAIAESP